MLNVASHEELVAAEEETAPTKIPKVQIVLSRGLRPGDALGDATPAYDLAGGTAGTVLFLVALAEATGDETFREGALRGADARPIDVHGRTSRACRAWSNPSESSLATPAASGGDYFDGEVVETMNAGGYTYVHVDTGSEKIWAAGPEVDEGN